MSINQQHGRKLALTIDNPPRNNNIKSIEKNLTFNETIDSKEETPNELLSKILDTINSNSLNIFYPDSNSDFKKKIDSLNLKFYLETEKYLSNKNRSEKCQTSLFIILFKQINIYIEEIERLNLIIIKRKYDPKKIIERTDELIKKQNEFLTKEKLIKTLKESKLNMETKLLESIINEDKLKKEIQTLKKENAIFKKQLSQNLDNKSINISNNINCKTHKKNSNNLLHKLTHPTFHSSTIKNLINDGNGYSRDNANKEKNDLYYNQGFENGGNSRKRNNSDNSKTILNNSFKKLYKIGVNKNKGGKLLFKNCQKKNDTNNINNNSINSFNHTVKNGQISISSYLNKKPTIHIKLNNGFNGYDNNHYGNNNTSLPMNKSINIDFDGIKAIKTEYVINDLDEYKKGVLLDYNTNIMTTDTKKNKDNNKDIKIKFGSKSKEKKDRNIIDKEYIINMKNKVSSSTQIPTVLGKNINERKKKHKINI